jgi:hypothetical protein
MTLPEDQLLKQMILGREMAMDPERKRIKG